MALHVKQIFFRETCQIPVHLFGFYWPAKEKYINLRKENTEIKRTRGPEPKGQGMQEANQKTPNT